MLRIQRSKYDARARYIFIRVLHLYTNNILSVVWSHTIIVLSLSRSVSLVCSFSRSFRSFFRQHRSAHAPASHWPSPRPGQRRRKKKKHYCQKKSDARAAETGVVGAIALCYSPATTAGNVRSLYSTYLKLNAYIELLRITRTTRPTAPKLTRPRPLYRFSAQNFSFI